MTGPTGLAGVAKPAGLSVEFNGQHTVVDRPEFTIGRLGDLVLDSANLHLHRRFLLIEYDAGYWMLRNVGRRLAATVTDRRLRLEALLGPGAVVTLTYPHILVRCVAGGTRYQFSIRVQSDYCLGDDAPSSNIIRGESTVEPIGMTDDQLKLLVALAEPTLSNLDTFGATLPTTQQLGRRLGWSITRVNRKIDNVCHKLATYGVGGLHGAPGDLAANRRLRLVEYALTSRLVTVDDLDRLEAARCE